MWRSNVGEWGNSFCGWGPSFGHGPWFLGWIFPVLFWGIMAYIMIRVLNHVFSANRSDQSDRSMSILRNRYASGEIDEQEYKSQKTILSLK